MYPPLFCVLPHRKVPGHKNVEGNEQADQAAKAPATLNTISPVTRMKPAQHQLIQSMTKAEWETVWKMGRENGRRLRNMSQYPSTTTRPKLYGALQQQSMWYGSYAYSQATAILTNISTVAIA
jgi:hypothetical protein